MRAASATVYSGVSNLSASVVLSAASSLRSIEPPWRPCTAADVADTVRSIHLGEGSAQTGLFRKRNKQRWNRVVAQRRFRRESRDPGRKVTPKHYARSLAERRYGGAEWLQREGPPR